MSATRPRTAALIAAYNSDETVRQAVESVLANTAPCDVFVVDDASHTPVAAVLGSLTQKVQIVRLPKNCGPARARNVGLEKILAAGYDYVSIVDADDISHPLRVAKQVEFLEKHPGVGAVGTWARRFKEESGATERYSRNPVDPAAIRRAMFTNIAVSHATVMFRADALRAVGLYCERYAVAEDYELMRRIALRFELANLPECLLDYRVSSNGQSLRRRRRQLYERLCIQCRYFELSQPAAWIGIARTLLLFVVPNKLITSWKVRLNHADSARAPPMP